MAMQTIVDPFEFASRSLPAGFVRSREAVQPRVEASVQIKEEPARVSVHFDAVRLRCWCSED